MTTQGLLHVVGVGVAPAQSAPPLSAVAVAAPVVAPEAVIQAARGPRLFWSAPEGERRWTFAGWGEAARVEANAASRLPTVAREASALLSRVSERRANNAAFAPAPRLFGGVAFLPSTPRACRPAFAAPPWGGFADASFALPRWLYGSDGERAFLQLVAPRDAAHVDQLLDSVRRWLVSLPTTQARGGAAEPGRLVEMIGCEAWRATIGDALERIRSGRLQKVVAATPSLFEAARAIDVGGLLGRLGDAHPACARFAIQRGQACFVGATPERLVSLSGCAVTAEALAGTAPRHGDDDASAIAALLASDKDRREHGLVVAAIEAALRPLCSALDVPSAPSVRTLRHVHHLLSPIAGRLAAPSHVLDLVARLHPSPAVCGTPRDEAARWIAEREPTPRGWYAGAVGWLSADGDGSLWVALRSGLVAGRRAWLYAGAGVVAGSDPDAELAEIRAKRRAMLDALGGGS